MNRARLGLAAAVTGTAGVLAAGYGAAGAAGLVDAASVAAVGALIVARGTVRAQKPPSVRPKSLWPGRNRAPAVSAADFPAYRKIFTDLSWAQVSWRHYQYPLRPMLARLAATLGRPEPMAAPGTRDPDGPGIDLATLNRVVTTLEGSAEP